MKLSQHPESHQLRLTHRGRFIGLNSVGLSILAFTGLIFYAASRSHQLRCRRVEINQVNCEVMEERFSTRQVSARTIANVQSASVEALPTGDATVYQVTLTGNDSETLKALQDSADQVEFHAAEIQRFLSNTDKNSLSLKSYPLLEPAAWIAFGIWSLLGMLPILVVLNV